MKTVLAILTFVNAILDRMPGRKESIYNEIDQVKSDIKKMQSFPSEHKWTAIDSGNYELLLNKLSALEARSKNAGF